VTLSEERFGDVGISGVLAMISFPGTGPMEKFLLVDFLGTYAQFKFEDLQF
jgi:hypothetical protein